MNETAVTPLPLLSVRDAAKLIGVHETTISYWVVTGKLPVFATVGVRTKLFLEADVRAAHESTRRPSPISTEGMSPESVALAAKCAAITGDELVEV